MSVRDNVDRRLEHAVWQSGFWSGVFTGFVGEAMIVVAWMIFLSR